MAMINCPVCGHAMSSTAAACPNCGHAMAAATTPAAHTAPVRKRRVGPGRWLAGLFFLVLLVLIALWYFDVVNFT
jgi:hypothetical protein